MKGRMRPKARLAFWQRRSVHSQMRAIQDRGMEHFMGDGMEPGNDDRNT